jgi:hypothetical protein
MPLLNRNAVSGRFAATSKKGEHATTKLHTVMLEAKRIRMAHAAGELTAEEAAEKLAELYNRHRFKSHRRSNSLLSA